MHPHQAINTFATAELIYRKAKSLHPFADYTGILTLNAFGRLALTADTPDEKARLLNEARTHYQPFLDGKAEFRLCNFQNYRCGGNGAAWLWWKGELPAANEATFSPYIEDILHQAPRDSQGILCHPKDAEEERIFIDIAFAVSPFLLYCGLALNRDDLIHQAWLEIRNLINALIVPDTRLVNQAINFRGPGHRSQDHWSRGNGWAIHALAALVESMPTNHPDRKQVETTFVAFVDACLKFQDPQSGLWHQEMTRPESYTETSGSGLILHAIGVGIASGVLSKTYRAPLEKGLHGYLSYISLDGSVRHSCVGCLSPNQGTKEDYMNRQHQLNDPHAFGPAIFALAQAHAIGIKTITV